MIHVPIYGRNGIRAFAVVDDEDLGLVSRHRWNLRDNYAVCRLATRPNGHRPQQSMHRLVLGLNPGDGLTGDHINHNTLDNRRENLRVATRDEQVANRRPRGTRLLSEGEPVTEVAGDKSGVEVALTRAGSPSESTPGPESISETPRPHMKRTKDAAPAAFKPRAAGSSLAVSRPAPVPAAAHIDDERVDKQFALSPLRDRAFPLADMEA